MTYCVQSLCNIRACMLLWFVTPSLTPCKHITDSAQACCAHTPSTWSRVDFKSKLSKCKSHLFFRCGLSQDVRIQFIAGFTMSTDASTCTCIKNIFTSFDYAGFINLFRRLSISSKIPMFGFFLRNIYHGIKYRKITWA